MARRRAQTPESTGKVTIGGARIGASQLPTTHLTSIRIPARFILKTMNWIKTEDKNPELNEYVIVYTPFCKSKCSVAFFNGIEWRSTDDKTEVWNIEYWMPLPILPEKKIIQKILDFG